MEHAHRSRLVIALLAGLIAPARAQTPETPETDASAQLVLVPSECLQFWELSGDPSWPGAWDAVLSLAACTQDRSVHSIDDAEQLADFVDELQTALAPSLRLYLAAIDEGPPQVRIHAAYYVALGQVALMTRARASLMTPELRSQLEPLLEPHAEVAYLVFSEIARAAAVDPWLAHDDVTRYMVRSACAHAASLRRSEWVVPEDDTPLLAAP
jgi:hypothetical protein